MTDFKKYIGIIKGLRAPLARYRQMIEGPPKDNARSRSERLRRV